MRLGAIDRGTTDLEAAAADADVVVVCTPVNRIADDIRRVAEKAPGARAVDRRGELEAADRRGGRTRIRVRRRLSWGRTRWPVPSGGASIMPGPTSSKAAFAY